MITFCLAFYIIVTFCMIFKCLFTSEGLEGVFTLFIGTGTFLILFIIGVLAMCKLYNIHLVVG